MTTNIQNQKKLPDTKTLILERSGSVLCIWFNRAEARNAISPEMIDELHAVLDALRDDQHPAQSDASAAKVRRVLRRRRYQGF